jgi:hypothetical protein
VLGAPPHFKASRWSSADYGAVFLGFDVIAQVNAITIRVY